MKIGVINIQHRHALRRGGRAKGLPVVRKQLGVRCLAHRHLGNWHLYSYQFSPLTFGPQAISYRLSYC